MSEKEQFTHPLEDHIPGLVYNPALTPFNVITEAHSIPVSLALILRLDPIHKNRKYLPQNECILSIPQKNLSVC
jgi:hypothetical protein